jgi:hypothetical protein
VEQFDGETLVDGGIDVEWNGRRKLVQLPLPFPGFWDAGDIELPPWRVVRVTVVDPAGKPVAGAVAMGDGPTADPVSGGPTDIVGEALWQWSGDVVGLRVAAMGFVPQRVRTEQLSAPEATIILQPGNHLVVRVSDANGQPASPVLVEVTAEQPPFTGEDGLPDAAMLWAGMDRGTSRGHPGPFRSAYRTNLRGEVVLSGLRPGLHLEITVRDLAGDLQHQVGWIVPERARDVIEVRLKGVLQSFSGIVVDGGDQPIPAARVRLVPAGQQDGESPLTESARTTRDGTFRFEGLYGFRGALLISAAGHATLIRPSFTLPTPESAPQRFVLQPEAVHRVRILCGTMPLEDLYIVKARGEGLWIGNGRHEGDGWFVFRGLPLRRITLQISLGGRTFHHDLHPGSKEGEWRLPPVGTVSVEIKRPVEGPEAWMVRLVPLNSSGDALETSLRVPRAGFPARTSFVRVLAGRYRADLVRCDQRDPTARTTVASQDLEVRAQEETTVAIR